MNEIRKIKVPNAYAYVLGEKIERGEETLQIVDIDEVFNTLYAVSLIERITIMPYAELLIGAGSSRDKRLSIPGQSPEWQGLVTLDNNPAHDPDIVADLTQLPLPFDADSFDEIHAYEVLEHLYRQGDYKSFFKEFEEYWRILKPNGHMFISVPYWQSVWAWGDPSHTRIIPVETFTFLNQAEYEKQVGKTPMSDFRHIYHADFEIVASEILYSQSTVVILKAIK